VKAAVIVATYDQPRWLDLALRGWARQMRPPSFIVVADDGSGEETRAVIERWGAVHVRQERGAGFGKCRAVNRAVARARDLGAEYLVFTDGDCLPARDLLARHLDEARPGRFLAGGVVRLAREASEAMSAAQIDSGAFERGEGGDKWHYLLPRPLGRALDALLPRRAPWKGGNASGWTADLLRVNGYDERFGWGSEDKELGVRLANAGVRGISIRYSAPVYHLWHERPYADAKVLARNEELLAETRRSRAARTAHGIETAEPGPAPGPATAPRP
jgi:glycosyltransferase involved in cell wall biosynthesis